MLPGLNLRLHKHRIGIKMDTPREQVNPILDAQERIALLKNLHQDNVESAESAGYPHQSTPGTSNALALLGAGKPYSPPYSTQMASTGE